MLMGLGSNSCFVTGAPFGHGYGFVNRMGHLRLDSFGLLVNDSIRTISGAPVLYYKSFGITLTLPKNG
jgi:hypothetical protein